MAQQLVETLVLTGLFTSPFASLIGSSRFNDALDEAYNYDDSIPFRRVLNSRLNPFGEKLVAPGIFDVLMRSLEIGSRSLEPSQIAKADVCLRPEVSRYGYTDISFLDDIAEAGYREAVERLAECELPIIPFEDGPS